MYIYIHILIEIHVIIWISFFRHYPYLFLRKMNILVPIYFCLYVCACILQLLLLSLQTAFILNVVGIYLAIITTASVIIFQNNSVRLCVA